MRYNYWTALLPLSILAAAQSGEAQTLTPAQVGPRADSVLRAAETRGFSGVVLVALGGTPVLEKGYGLANRSKQIRFGPSTVVQIGSNTKDFTTVAILQLQQRGRLELTDSIGKYFPVVPSDKRAITIAQLLNHTAGIPANFGGDFEPVEREEFIRNAMTRPLAHRPGERRLYSNAGYSLLAAIIEQLSGRSYDEYVRDNILMPLGLTRTGFYLPGYAVDDLARGYRGDGDQGVMLEKPRAADGPYWNLRGNGGMLSTVGDMHRFYSALFNTTTLLSAAARDRFFPPGQPTVLAGSDGVNFFLYSREPALGLEIHIASTNAEVKAPQVHGDLLVALGVRAPDRQETARANAPAITIPDTPHGRTVNEYLRAFNSGDTTVMQRFFEQRLLPRAGDTRTIADRVARYRGLHAEVGMLTPTGFAPAAGGVVEVKARSQHEGPVVLLFEIETEAPYRIKSLQIGVGG